MFSQFQAHLGSSLPNDDYLADIQHDVIYLGNKDNSDHFVERGPILVDGSGDGQHEAAESHIDLHVLFTALEGDGQSGGA